MTVESMKNQQFVNAQRAAAGLPPLQPGQVQEGPVQETPLDQVEHEIDRVEKMWNPVDDITPSRMLPGMKLVGEAHEGDNEEMEEY